MKALIAVLPGDGIGPAVVEQALRVLDLVERLGGHHFDTHLGQIGATAITSCGDPLPADTLETCRSSDAILLGAVGHPDWSDPDAPVRPEQGLLRLRAELGLFANLRPVRTSPALLPFAPLRADRLVDVDLLIVRELTGGIYFGPRSRTESSAFDTSSYSVEEIERIGRHAFAAARRRGGHLVSVDKANVLETSRLWRRTMDRLARTEFPDVRLEHMLVDAAAMHLLTRPRDFDVLVTDNMFGDILSDEASVLAGALGMLPSASLAGNAGGGCGRGLYEPVHGAAHDIAGGDGANPYGCILSAALLLRHSLGLEREAAAVEAAVDAALSAGTLSADLMDNGGRPATTEEIGDAVLAELRERLEDGRGEPSSTARSASGFPPRRRYGMGIP